MQITIKSPNGPDRTIPISPAMQKHWGIPINHAQTILDQINNGMYEKWFKGKKDLTVIDFGANVGLTALYFLPACKELHVVEPTPEHQKLLGELITANAGETRVVSYQMVLAEKSGEFHFATGHSTENKITSANGHGAHKIGVHGEPLSWYLNQTKNIVDFIKCDVEGGEIFALTQEQLDLSKGRVRTFFVECHPTQNYGMEGCVVELTNRFKNAGYVVEQIDYQTFVASYEC